MDLSDDENATENVSNTDQSSCYEWNDQMWTGDAPTEPVISKCGQIKCESCKIQTIARQSPQNTDSMPLADNLLSKQNFVWYQPEQHWWGLQGTGDANSTNVNCLFSSKASSMMA